MTIIKVGINLHHDCHVSEHPAFISLAYILCQQCETTTHTRADWETWVYASGQCIVHMCVCAYLCVTGPIDLHTFTHTHNWCTASLGLLGPGDRDKNKSYFLLSIDWFYSCMPKILNLKKQNKTKPWQPRNECIFTTIYYHHTWIILVYMCTWV